MSESRVRKRRHAGVLEANPVCIYCGTNAATTIDHMPPRVMFRLSQRPKGLEFASCRPCNEGTKRADLAATLFARTMPGIRDEKEGAEWDRLLRDTDQAVPGLLQEIFVQNPHQSALIRQMGLESETRYLFAGGPLAFAHMTAFGAKAGFALYFDAVKTIAHPDRRVQVRWFTNDELQNDVVPTSLTESLGAFKTLEQGKLTAKGEFEYARGSFEGSGATVFYVVARQAFGICAFVADAPSDLPFPEAELATFKPGDFQRPLSEKVKMPISKEDWLAATLNSPVRLPPTII
jgi:hypothetical protein